MRLVHQKMIALVKAQKAGSAGSNTVVTIGEREDGLALARVYLHGHHIATVLAEQDPREGRPVTFTLAGYPTVTTRSRINALLQAFQPGARVWQRDGEQYAECPRFGVRDGAKREISPTEWVTA